MGQTDGRIDKQTDRQNYDSIAAHAVKNDRGRSVQPAHTTTTDRFACFSL